MAGTVRKISDDRLMKALAHPLRVEMLRLMEHDEWSPKRLADELELPLPNVAYHMQVLRKLMLVRQVRTVGRRGAIEHFFRAVPASVDPELLDELPAVARNRLIASELAQLVGVASDAAGAGGFDVPQAQLARVSLRLDEKGRRALLQATEKFAAALDKLASAEGGTPFVVGWMAFEERDAKPQPRARGFQPRGSAKQRAASRA